MIDTVRAVLTDDLLLPKYRGGANKFSGHCYVASEALYHLLGGKKAGYKPMHMRVGDVSHWFLIKDGDILDPTVGQFDSIPDYKSARGCGFLTRKPSKRAQIVIDRCNVLTSNDSSWFWESVERAAAEVATWPQWKRAGVVARFEGSGK